MQNRKPRPPVWQQGASRSYIEDPDAAIPDSTAPVSARRFVVLRCVQAALLLAWLVSVAGVEAHPEEHPLWISWLGWLAVVIDLRLRSRIAARPAPSRTEKTQGLVALAVVVAWGILQALLLVRVFGTPTAAEAWILTAALGAVVVPVFVFTAQRARYFRWKETA